MANFFTELFRNAIGRPAGVFNEALNDAAEATWNKLGVDTSASRPYTTILNDEDRTRYQEDPVRELAKATAVAGSYAVPFGGFGAASYAANPLANTAAKYAIPGAIEGLTGGFGQSNPGDELRDTLIGGGVGTAASLAGGLLTDQAFRKMLGDYLQEGTSQAIRPDFYGANIDLMGGLRSEAMSGIDPKEIIKLENYYKNMGATNRTQALNDLELLQRAKPTQAGLDYIKALADSGEIDPWQIRIPMMAYEDALGKVKGISTQRGFQTYEDQLEDILSNNLGEGRISDDVFRPMSEVLEDEKVIGGTPIGDYIFGDKPGNQLYQDIIENLKKQGAL